MNLLQAAKKALDAFEWSWGGEPLPTLEWEAMQDLRKAIDEAEKQEPVGEIVQAFDDLVAVSIPIMPPVGTKLYTAPVQAEKSQLLGNSEQLGWVGLTDAEIMAIAELSFSWNEYTRAIEAKLKEKNHV